MNFPKIYYSKELLDMILRELKKDKDLQRKDKFTQYISKLQLTIMNKLEKILSKLPDYKNMNEYYKLMCKNIISENTIEKYKNHYRVTITIINRLCETYKKKSKNIKKVKEYNKIKKELIGRISSVIKKLDSTNKCLIKYSKEFKRIAKPNFNLYTIVLIGNPNSGKTTLLKKITKASPEINSYAFTTKALNIGYFKIRKETIQVIDTPGLIHKEFKKMNAIEKQAIVAIKTLANIIVFVYNPYDELKQQVDLLEYIKKNNPNKKIVVFGNYNKKMPNYKNVRIKDILNKKF